MKEKEIKKTTMKTSTLLAFIICLCTALYFGKPKEPVSKKPYTQCGKQIIKKGYVFQPLEEIEIKEHRNHYGCNGLRCPLIR